MATVLSPSTPGAAQADAHNFDLFVQVQGRSQMHLVTIVAEATVADLIALIVASGLMPTGAGDLLLSLPDAEHPVDPHRRLHEADVLHHHQLHCHRHVRLDVQVRFSGQSKGHAFSPAVTFARIHAWATGPHGFRLSELDASEHVLQVAATGAQPSLNDHLGSVAGSECHLVLDLVPKYRIEG